MMSYSCRDHGWQHLLSPCPACSQQFVVTGNTIMSRSAHRFTHDECQANLERIKEAYLALLQQACGDHPPGAAEFNYDPLGLPGYETALDLAIDLGWIEEGQVLR